ncbi:MAG: chemotaxis protein CheR [Micavibrio aeruginosavorus]|uniref:Chemotaxis protein CheR n=1 Tax=Micavibrio aeruginosavorus TaxID=349221 RepID=A0A2W5MVE1_9BACT|nr:MAG: chemotaxis protein CheR [Micavibrio aeruginosavorus]
MDATIKKDSSMSVEDMEIKLMLEAIYHKYHYDFRGYSPASLKRRLSLARTHFQCDSFSQLQDLILKNQTVFPRMIDFMTVQVSELFRDPHYFKSIREHVVPHLRTYPSLRIWVAGCSAGEELYSLAILFREEGLEDRTMFYATDINHEALLRAESGVYALDRMQLFSENYQKSGGKKSLSQYYTAAYGAATFDKTLRERTVFSDHSLVTDNVFAEMHFISCRNVLIYFDRDFQDRAIGLFRNSLIRKGFLGLGAKESLRFSAHADAFEEFIREERIYQRKSGS